MYSYTLINRSKKTNVFIGLSIVFIIYLCIIFSLLYLNFDTIQIFFSIIFLVLCYIFPVLVFILKTTFITFSTENIVYGNTIFRKSIPIYLIKEIRFDMDNDIITIIQDNKKTRFFFILDLNEDLNAVHEVIYNIINLKGKIFLNIIRNRNNN